MAATNPLDIAEGRLQSQRIAGAGFKTPGEVVAWMGAVQAQDYLAALWAVGLRMAKAREETIEEAIADRTIVRTWPMRGTLHFVAPADVRWMLALLVPRALGGRRARYRELELEQSTFDRSRDLLTFALEGRRRLTRESLYEVLEAAGISTAGQRGIHILQWLAWDGLLCFAARQGKQQTFALLDEWVPPAPTLTREESLAELAGRYFTSHGPATVQDFSWWTGLTVADAKKGIELAGSRLEWVTIEGRTYGLGPKTRAAKAEPEAYLLPAFDEYAVGYRDRSAILHEDHPGIVSTNGIVYPAIVIDGQVVGTWKRVSQRSSVAIKLSPFRQLKKKEQQAVEQAAEEYGMFLGKRVVVGFVEP